MSNPRLARLEEIFHRALEAPPEERQGILDEAQQVVQKLMDPDDEASAVPLDSGD